MFVISSVDLHLSRCGGFRRQVLLNVFSAYFSVVSAPPYRPLLVPLQDHQRSSVAELSSPWPRKSIQKGFKKGCLDYKARKISRWPTGLRKNVPMRGPARS